MSEIKLHMPRAMEQRCRDWCRKWFPLEAYGLLLGTFVGDSVFVDAVWTPSDEDAQECFKSGKIFFKEEWLAELLDEHQEEGFRIVGDFHSHPYKRGESRFDPVQSVLDIANAGAYPIYGVCNVEEIKGKKLRTDLRWWGPSVRVTVIRRRKNGHR